MQLVLLIGVTLVIDYFYRVKFIDLRVDLLLINLDDPQDGRINRVRHRDPRPENHINLCAVVMLTDKLNTVSVTE